ncbi:MAG: IS481 family transposase [Fodinibius sp.]|nr:IS481 family transposase [Fodinibius sp.]
MPWKNQQTTMELRAEFVQLADQPTANMSQLCRRFGISRPTGYKWLRRWRQEGKPGLADRCRRPHHSPNKTPEHIEAVIIQARRRFPGWGGRKLRRWIRNKIDDGTFGLSVEQLPVPSTITRILDRHNLLGNPSETRRNKTYKRFERDRPNQLWQLDFKGEFPLMGGPLCYPLTLVDDHSRFCVLLEACRNQQRETVQQLLETAFRRYGLPKAILLDNGPPWGAGIGWRADGPYYTGLTAWLMLLGINVIYARPGQPQTKGKNERFNGTLQAELLEWRQFSGWPEVNQSFTRWRRIYNTERPHEALDMEVPAQHFQPSPVAFPTKLPEVSYGPDDQQRKVNVEGRISFQGDQYRVGKAFGGYPVALRPNGQPEKWNVYFCHQHIRTIHLTD